MEHFNHQGEEYPPHPSFESGLTQKHVATLDGQLTLDLLWPEPTYIDRNEGVASTKEVQMTQSLLIAIVQVLEGRRRILTIEPLLAPKVQSALKSRLRHHATRQPLGRLLTIHTYKPRKSVIEACATTYRGQRAQALAARLERRHRQWQCTLLQLVD